MIKTFKGNSGSKVVIMGALHGDEPIGALVIEALKKELIKEEINGEIILLIGNPNALKEKKRFLDTDLNRIFHLKFTKPLNREEKRALELSKILADTDYLLDIHSTGKPSIPFVYCKNTKEHFELAKIFETKYTVTSSSDFKAQKTTVSSDNFVDEHGGIGITFETGWNKDFATFKKALQKSKEFLSSLEIAFRKTKVHKSKSTILEVQEYLIPKTKDFILNKDFNNFELVKANEPIAKDGTNSIKRTYNSYIVFPKKEFTPGIPAAYLAKKL